MGELAVFAYGSLMHERVAPDLMLREEKVTLPGYERVFHKVSWVRGCHPHDAILEVEGVPDRFKTPERNLSLVLGLRRNPHSRVIGFLQTYPSDAAQDVLKRLDAREGFHAREPLEKQAYHRRPCYVERRDKSTVEAVSYFTNTDSDWVQDDLPTDTQAAILASATCKSEGSGTKARGLFYLEGVRQSLAEHGCHDQILEHLTRCAYKWSSGRLNLLPPIL